MQSTRYRIADAFHATVQAVATAQGADCLKNPRLPIDTKGKADKLLFVIDRGSKLEGQPGQRNERRRARVVVGALALTAAADADADALLFKAADALRTDAQRAALKAAGAVGPAREVELEPELKDMAAEGALMISAYEIEYFENYPNAA